MRYIDAHFTYHSVGQGLFYSGHIHHIANTKSSPSDFHFVYDCGNTNKKLIKKQIEKQFKDQFENQFKPFAERKKSLDLLIISHFDTDHISGIKQLLETTNGVNEVVLPYLPPEDRYFYYFYNNPDEDPSDDTLNFLENPTRFLKDLNANKITYILPGEPEKQWAPPSEQQINEYEWYPNEPQDKTIYLEPDESNDDTITIRKHNCIYRNKRPLWGFKFFCPQTPENLTKIIKNKLSEICPSRKASDLVHQNFDKVKSIYKQIIRNTEANKLSLICCHGPALPRSNPPKKIEPYLFCIKSNTVNEDAAAKQNTSIRSCISDRNFDIEVNTSNNALLYPPAQLLTGDSEAKPNDYKAHFENELNQIYSLSVPHHGSKKNWDDNFTNVFPYCAWWVVSYGNNNNYGHPSEGIEEHLQQQTTQWRLKTASFPKETKLANLNMQLVHCNENQRIGLHLIMPLD